MNIPAHEILEKALGYLPYEPFPDQLRLLGALSDYVSAREPAEVFILNGHAGTGKTSLMGALVKVMAEMAIPHVVLAPTGRAAKVASGFSQGRAYTIHKRIFRADSSSPDARFFLAPNTQPDTIFIVDEASLITDNPSEGNSLLCQMLRHIYAAPRCGLILMGDTSQLPPVGQADSPAMNPDRLRNLGLDPIYHQLTRTARQKVESGILYNAILIRNIIEQCRTMKSGQEYPMPRLKTGGFPDVKVVGGEELADALSDSWGEVGAEETLLVTRSNHRANNYNMAVRNMVMYAEEPLQQGDRIVIAKNDYYWSKINKLETFIANGDIAIVKWVGRTEKMYGRYFVDTELYFPSEGEEIGAKLMLRSLMAEGPSLPRDEMHRFYNHVLSQQEGEISKKIKAVGEDPYYNALQAKYAYCVTCHKAQGGQWKHVYIDLAGIQKDAISLDFYRWLYTAVTRATEKLFLINPSFGID